MFKVIYRIIIKNNIIIPLYINNFILFFKFLFITKLIIYNLNVILYYVEFIKIFIVLII